MQRAASFKLDQLTAESAAFVQHCGDFIHYLERSLQPELLNLLALPELEGEYCSFYTFLEGEVHSVDAAAADAFFKGKSAQLAAAVAAMQQDPYADAASFVLSCINNPRHLTAVAGNKVILPVILKSDPPPAASAPPPPSPPPAAPAPGKSPRSKLPWLLLLLLLLLLAALAAGLLNKDDGGEQAAAPDKTAAAQVQEAAPEAAPAPAASPKPEPIPAAVPEAAPAPAAEPAAAKRAEESPAQPYVRENAVEPAQPELNLPAAPEAEPRPEPAATLPQGNALAEAGNEDKDQEEAAQPEGIVSAIAPIPEGEGAYLAPFPEAEDEGTKLALLPEPELEIKPEIKAEAAPEPAPAPKKEQAAAAKAAAPAKKAKPKCTVLKQENKLPSLILAVDGSASMFERLGRSGTTRMAAAQQAAIGMIDNINTSVRVNLIDINSCPAARNYGWFGGSRQSRFSLRGMIRNLRPLGNGTALLSGLNQVAAAAKNTKGQVEAVMISDGLDTCGNDISAICRRAQNIHRAQPDFKINVVILDESISGLKCVAQATGGRVFHPQNAAEFARQLQQVGSGLNEVCEE